MIEAKRNLGLIFFPAYDWAISPTHPERQERLLYTQDQLREEGIFDIKGISEYKPRMASDTDIMRTHFCFPDVESVVTDSHRISAGGAIRAAQLVCEGKEKRSFALVRPPGHHAMKTVHGNRGFCNVNNEAIMIDYLREKYGIRKVAIVDTDCHHGDGTQDIYWDDPDVLFISLHQDGRTLYPGSGHIDETGGPNARGRTINIPLPPGTSDRGFLFCIEEMVLPILKDFKPELIINSAGQDNHYTDPITNMALSARGYARLNELLDPHISVLEGGYSIRGALPYVNCGIILAMAGMDYSHVKEPDYDDHYREQDDKISEYIEGLKDSVLEAYFNPSPGKIDLDEEEFYSEYRTVYYDTDQISDQQRVRVKACSSCGGMLVIESAGPQNSSGVGVEIPLYSCEECRVLGHSLYNTYGSHGDFDTVFLMDKASGQYSRFEK